MTQFLRIGKQYADCSGKTMETGDHSKNGASPKSQTSRRNLKLFTLLVLMIGIFAIVSCNKDGVEAEDYAPTSVMLIIK